MAVLNTLADWWALVDEHWESYRECSALAVRRPTLPFDGPARFEDSRLNVAAPNFWERMTKAKNDRDHETVYNGLEMIWEGAPDNGSIHDWPHWGDLCDLCSEIWVFNPDEAGEPYVGDDAAF